ncbi:MAG: restriction endonuclease subunit S, partial [candidate division WOR-3 bacterium]|nr:restriction endonuclease subunit S [candidate division WOR-3 bacterium]
VPLLRIQNITDWGINFNSDIFLPTNYLEKYAKFKLLNRDILISMTGAKEGTGSVGKVAINDKEQEDALVNQRVGILRTKLKEICDYYLYSYLKTEVFRILLIRNSVISVQVNASEDDILNLPIPLPPLYIQNQIAEEVKNRIEKAKKLKEEAKNIVENAKKEVEKIILAK